MGREAVRTLLRPEIASAVTNLDRLRPLRRLARRRAGAALGLDISNERALREALAAHDMALNTVGPFYRFGVPILRAAIETGTTYLDVCDDVEPTVEIPSR
jgi:saccharopine dehydrogenase-like NADP-dependent oxidoreductase